MSDAVVIAVSTAVPATIAAMAGYLQARKAAHQVKPSNGSTLAQLIETHIEQDAINFRILGRWMGVPERALRQIDEDPDHPTPNLSVPPNPPH